MLRTFATLRVPYSDITYDRRVGRYRGQNGRFLDPRTVRNILDADIDIRKSRLDTFCSPVAVAATAYQEGRISRQQYEQVVDEWTRSMAEEVRVLHLAALAQAKGGFHALTQEDYGRAGFYIREQYAYLAKRRERLLSDPKYAASDSFVRHAESYGEAARGTYEAQREIEDARIGLNFEFNELDELASHCKGDNSCIEQTRRGVVRRGELSRVGSRICGPECRCHVRRFASRAEAEKQYAISQGETKAVHHVFRSHALGL